ncbi:NUDIX hydrolase [Alkaliphilus peptidifermentans]|uniref:NUDIX domain-containing protein n=1 Tax=Alkaliphilus peptidifermentans DSM 18978 TaxID=1120976 RepID=A0A1G5LFE5_9FIRM|nr:NUDIX hydrolase [Alkaliphilus peptidifermentans]SCZ11645.1 NUDIX domain-containing protein [Alkaliphilus peptidifermentans DSM 18978]
MDFIKKINEFIPNNNQESQDKKVILDYIKQFSHNILSRNNEIAHITSSGFIMNYSLDRVLMVHHNIRNSWAWTGGHADGDANLLQVAIKEAREETGVNNVIPLSENILSIDILPVFGHMRKDKYVNAHLHLSVAYVLIASDKETLVINKDENSGVSWFTIDEFTDAHFDKYDAYLYGKLIKRANEINVRIT